MRTTMITKPRWTDVRMALTEMGMAVLMGASLAMLSVLAEVGPPAELWWSSIAQLAALSVGVGVGALLGWRALSHRASPRLNARRTPPTRPAAPAS
jgi:hypothetical protein